MAKVIKTKKELLNLEKGEYFICPKAKKYISTELIDSLIDMDAPDPYTLKDIGKISIDENGESILIIE